MECKNGWTYGEIIMNFGSTKETLKNCERCDELKYDDGVMSCGKIKTGGLLDDANKKS